MNDDEIWMPPTSSGKADGSTIIEGSTIPSQFVDASKHYLTGRRIDTLDSVGALIGTPGSVARRADGIIANLPANGRMEAAELARMENPEIFATLFPEEQMELPKLWAILEAPFPAVQVNALPLDLAITDKRVEPSGLVVPPSLLINSLPAEFQTLAKRVQLVFNADANAATIEIADIDNVLVMPQAFTPAEVEQLKAIRLIFIERATSDCEAKVMVPAPGHQSATTTFGMMSLELTADIAIRERRTLYASGWNAQFGIDADLAATLTSPPGGRVVAIELGSGGEFIVEDGRIDTRQSTQLVIERWVNGVREESHDLALPPINSGHKRLDLLPFVDFALVTQANVPLVKYPVDTPAANATIVDFEYGVTANPNPLVDLNKVASVATPALAIPTGRYSVPLQGLGNVAMDVYPGSVVFISGIKANPAWSNEKMLYANVNGSTTRKFTPSTSELSAWWYPGNSARTIVRASMRTQ
jgi:hypothetical protein